MAESIEVVLVDGCGNPRIVAIVSDDGSVPTTVGFANQGIRSGPDRLATFDYAVNCAINGMAVYRQRDCGDPRIRFEQLKPVSQPFNQPRVTP